MKFINTGRVKIGQHYVKPPQRIAFTDDEYLIQSVLLGEPIFRWKRTHAKILLALIILLVLRIVL
jgi:hypothetical protein